MSPKKKRIPTKSELTQLQRIYKTDEKIGERLGGVPAYLVAYWRRKKNIPKHSQPKFSEKEIIALWERFGDDDKCGLELGISKAAFYNWRRRYGIKQKPAFLKLEQLELNFPGLKLSSENSSLYGKKTLIQKIASEKLQQSNVEIGEEVELDIDMNVAHISAVDIIEKFKLLKTDLVWNPNKILISMGNCSDRLFDDIPQAYQIIRDFVKRQGIKNFYEASEGVCYQVAIEKGHIIPGQLIVGSNKYVSTYGALATSQFQLDETSLADCWVTGKASFKIPASVQINISGRRSRGVYGKDIALSVLKQMAPVDIKNKAVEFSGNTVNQMSISERITLCNHAADTRAFSATCNFDSVTRRYLTGRTLTNYTPIMADKNAEYDDIYQINIDHLAPQIGRPNDADSIKPVAETEGLPANVIIIGTPVNGRFDDLRIAAEVLKGKQVSPECRLLIYPGSRTVYLEALKKGLIRVLVEAGAIIIYPGYPDTASRQSKLVTENDRVLATSNDSLIPEIIHDKTDVYLCSPATAAVSSLNGTITDPSRYVK